MNRELLKKCIQLTNASDFVLNWKQRLNGMSRSVQCFVPFNTFINDFADRLENIGSHLQIT